jgi:hypothetical protein
MLHGNTYILLNSYYNIMNQDYVKELEQILADKFHDFFPDGIPGKVERESFQSETFRAAGFHTLPDRYGTSDRSLYTVKGEGGSITFVVTGKVSSDNPFEVMHASLSGVLDLRKDMTIVYQFDGKDKITETQIKTGARNEYSGPNGNPDVLLSYLRSTLGTPVTE